MSTRLERSQKERMIAGVCGGIAEYLQLEVIWVRLVFAVLGVFGGIGVLAYIVLLIIMPLPGQRSVPDATPTESTQPTARAESTARIEATGPEPRVEVAPPVDTERRRQIAGYALIAIGLIFLLNNQGVFRFLEWRYVWPLALVAIGVLLLAQRIRR